MVRYVHLFCLKYLLFDVLSELTLTKKKKKKKKKSMSRTPQLPAPPSSLLPSPLPTPPPFPHSKFSRVNLSHSSSTTWRLFGLVLSNQFNVLSHFREKRRELGSQEVGDGKLTSRGMRKGGGGEGGRGGRGEQWEAGGGYK